MSTLATFLTALAMTPGAAPDRPLIPPPSVTSVTRAACPDGSGSACADRATATVYLPRGTSRFAAEHELGHLYDAQRLDDGERAKIRRLLGLRGAWRTGTGLSGLGSPSEWFADAYAACRLQLDPERRWESAYGYQPTRRQHREVCWTIARASD